MSDPNPRTQRYLEILDSVLDIAHDALKQRPQHPLAPAEIERLARTIRRTILLAQKIAEPPKPDRKQARKRIIREVEDYINRTINDDDEANTLQADLLDRLDSPDLEEEIDNRPVPEIIIDIVRDLGLDTDWGPNRFKRRFQQDVAALAARAAELLPEQPTPLRNTARAPRIKAPNIDHLTSAQAVAAILHYGHPRDG